VEENMQRQNGSIL
jgi:hypothetical protein